MLSIKEIQTLQPKNEKYNKGCRCSNGLTLEISSIKQGGTKCFVGRRRFRGKQTSCYIGSYGKGYGQFDSTSKANTEWIKRIEWAETTGRNPSDYGKKDISKEKTLEDAIQSFLKKKSYEIKETSLREYSRKLNNMVLSRLDKDTPLKELEWGDGRGREEIMRVVEGIRDGGKGNNVDLARRCQDRLKDVFNHAIAQGWMSRGQNPAIRPEGEKNPHKPSHHKSVSWEEVPKLIKEINLNRINAHPLSVLSTKLCALTFLRGGALTRLQWSWIKKVDGILCFEMSGDTSGLKRKKGKNDHIPHHVPITKNIQKILDVLEDYRDESDYVFAPLRGSRFPHIDPSTPNNYLRNIGYQNKMVAHGWRTIALTNGQEKLGADYEIIQRQMGHLVGDKVRQAYDKSRMLKERKDFLDKWGDLLVKKGLSL